MYNIGIISALENDTYDYLTELECNVYTIFPEDIKKNTKNMDICIIETIGIESIYETILLVREVFKGLLWLVDKNETEKADLNERVCFRLGVHGITNYHEGQGNFILQLKNFITYSMGQNKHIDKKVSELPFELDVRRLAVLKNGEGIYLTKLEFNFLELLMNNQGKVVTYEEIYKKLWPKSINEPKSIQIRISNLAFLLRKKIEDNPKEPLMIRTVRSVGYLLDIELFS